MKMQRRLFIKQSALTLGTLAMGPALWGNIGFAESDATKPIYPTHSQSYPKIHFSENFRNYTDHAPDCVDVPGITIGNDPIHSMSAQADVNLEKPGFIFKKFSSLVNAASNLDDYDVLFKFRLREDKDKTLSKFALHLHHDLKGKTGDVIVGIAADEVKISSDGITPAVTGGAKLPFSINKNDWHTAVVTVRGSKMEVFIDDNRVMKQVAEATVPAAPSAGVNFYGFKDSPFSITDIVVRDPGPLPNHTITNILPAALVIDSTAYKSGVSQTVAANDIFGATIRTGLEKDAVKMTINWDDGKTNDIGFNAQGLSEARTIQKDGKSVKENFEGTDAIIQITGIDSVKSHLDYYIRPMLRRYKSGKNSFTETYHDIIRDWDLLPKASEHPLKVDLRKTDSGVDLYLDSCYAGSIAGVGVKNITFALAPTASIGYPVSVKREYDPQKYLPLDVAALDMAKSFVDAKTSINPGLSQVKDIPMYVAAGAGSADIGLTRQGQGNWGLEVDEYLARSPFDGLLTEVHFTVPGGVPYTNAWVLCAVDPDPVKDPILTTRITHYAQFGVGGNVIADTTMDLPRGNEKPGEGVTQVGTVSKTDENGKKIEIPLYLVKVPLNSGKILDQYKFPSMDFDFFGKPDINYEQIDRSMKPDPNSTSAVQVFGATLEKSSVGMDFVQSQHGNIFANDETPETTAVLGSFVPAKGKLLWDIYDVNDKKVGGSSADYNFTKPGEEQKFTLPLKMPQLGWYRIQISAQDQNGETLFTHPASFALLGKDERKASYESPYGTWWFDGAHKTPDLDIAGPTMFKAGIHKAGWTKHTEAQMAQWSITNPQVRVPFEFADIANPEKALQNAEAAMRKALVDWPHLREVLIFHESGPGFNVPMEAVGLKSDNQTPDRIAREKRYADVVNLVGPMLREKFPQLKTVVGNNSNSAATIAAILRQGGNPDYIDYLGIEAASQMFIPEKVQEWALQGMRITTDTAKALSGRDIPANGCYEFTFRADRDIGQQEQAEWYARDVLISLANNFTTICPGLLYDSNDAYYNVYWGASAKLERSPYGYPKRSYVSYAALTNVLDQVKFRRQIPTGSTTVFAVEFDRADNKLATGLWASRGEANFNITFSGDTPVKVVDMYGATSELKTTGGKLTVNAGVKPVYLVAEKEISSITLSNRTFSKDDARAKLSIVAAPFDDIADVTLDKNNSLDTPQVFPLRCPIRLLGDFDLRQATDAQKGKALELQLNTAKNPNLNKYITEYTTIRLKSPAPVSGEPAALGVWVKGNSNWGRPMFEIEDAEGEVWRSIGTGGWGVDILDWPGNLATNFDGWNFVSLPLRATNLFNDHSPGPVLEQWVSSGGDKKIEYPIKIRAITVEMNRKPLDLIDFKTANPVIQLKDVSGIYEK